MHSQSQSEKLRIDLAIYHSKSKMCKSHFRSCNTSTLPCWVGHWLQVGFSYLFKKKNKNKKKITLLLVDSRWFQPVTCYLQWSGVHTPCPVYGTNSLHIGPKTVNYTLHYTGLHCIALAVLGSAALHCSTLHCTALLHY